MFPAANAQTDVTVNVITKKVGTIMANCNPRGRAASMNWGKNAAMKIKLLGFGIVMTIP
jgi:hypothetical protein